jgi:tetratricopeptide (TPR) repeat protein
MSASEQVEQLKNQGNAAMGSSAEKAIELYTRALALDAAHVATLTNRAQAYLKTGKFAECVDDCTAALRVDACNTKALFRRASAYKELQRPEAAMADLSKLLGVDPGNLVAREQLNQLKWTAKSAARSARLAPKPASANGDRSAAEPQVADAAAIREIDEMEQAPPVREQAAAPKQAAAAAQARKPQITVVPSGDADRILSRPLPANTAQYEALVMELFATPLSREEKLARLGAFLRRPLVNLAALFTAEMEETALSTTLEAVATSAATGADAQFCKRFLDALHSMPRFDLFSMCIDTISQARLDTIGNVGNSSS